MTSETCSFYDLSSGLLLSDLLPHNGNGLVVCIKSLLSIPALLFPPPRVQ
jgi:hypothetical protein